jgi:hypothetical protein
MTIEMCPVVRRFSMDVPIGTTAPHIVHPLDTEDVLVVVVEKQSSRVGEFRQAVMVDWWVKNDTTVVLNFANAPVEGQYRVTVMG